MLQHPQELINHQPNDPIASNVKPNPVHFTLSAPDYSFKRFFARCQIWSNLPADSLPVWVFCKLG
jgi:hypothetical protein